MFKYFKRQSYFNSSKTIKEDVFDSVYLAEIMDSYEQVCLLIDESELKLKKLKRGDKISTPQSLANKLKIEELKE